MLRITIILLLSLLASASFGQSKPKKKSTKKGKNEQVAQQPSSLEPFYPKQNYEPKKKKSSGKVTYNAREQFYGRMEEVAKAHRKAEKELSKPQYSDPSYFGHKRPPKKRPPHKMKYCKVCGIRH